MTDKNDPYGFIAFRRDDSGHIESFRTFSTVDELEKRKGGQEERTDGEKVNSEDKKEAEQTEGSELQKRTTHLLDGFKNTMASIHSMIAFVTMMAPAIRFILIEHEFLKWAEEHLRLLEREDDRVVFSYTEYQFAEIKKHLEKYIETREGHDTLSNAILLGLVAMFDSYFSAILRLFLSIHPESEVNELMRKSHTEQIKFVESNLNVSIIAHYERWPNFGEIFERRNLVAHGNLIVNEIYAKNCKKVKYTDASKLTIGETLRLSPKYLHSSVEVLTEFGILLVFVLGRKHITAQDDKAFQYLNHTGFELIASKRPRLARRLLEFGVKQKKGCSEETYRMMIVNLANSHKKLKDDAGCLKVIDGIDWSASRDDFRICVALLRGDIDKFIELLPKSAASKSISVRSFREWPVFDWIRDDKRIALEFERVFGEPIARPTVTSVTDGRAEFEENFENTPPDENMTRH